MNTRRRALGFTVSFMTAIRFKTASGCAATGSELPLPAVGCNGASVADVFVSYASVDRERARALSEVLADRGLSVWWDRTIAPGRVFDEVIQEELNAAKCVVVLWSPASVKSNWVKTEAAEAAARGILVPVSVQDVALPIEFKRIQAANLTDWHGERDH